MDRILMQLCEALIQELITNKTMWDELDAVEHNRPNEVLRNILDIVADFDYRRIVTAEDVIREKELELGEPEYRDRYDEMAQAYLYEGERA